MRTGERGFTYLILLFFVAITAAALAALGQAWQNAAERERETELEFRGNEIARAIYSYRKASSGPEQNPLSLDDLLEDRRGAKVLHHLRQLYPDPFTSQADWVLVPDATDPRRFTAVHSHSDHALLRMRQSAVPGAPQSAGQGGQIASDWVFRASDFEAGLPADPPANPASAVFGTPSASQNGIF